MESTSQIGLAGNSYPIEARWSSRLAGPDEKTARAAASDSLRLIGHHERDSRRRSTVARRVATRALWRDTEAGQLNVNAQRAAVSGSLAAALAIAVTGLASGLTGDTGGSPLLNSLPLETVGPEAMMSLVLACLAVGGLVGIGYSWVFENLARRATIGLGVILGLVHALVSCLIVAAVLEIRRPAAEPAAGFIPLLVTLVALHVLYGAVLGAMYRPAMMIDPAPLPGR